MTHFKRHVISRGYELDEQDWEGVSQGAKAIEAKRGDIIMDSATVADHLYFVCDGIAASIQLTPDGETPIARFFEPGQVCTNLTSAWNKTVSADQLVAMTEFTGLCFPFSAMREAYFHGGPLALYWRETVFETLVFDKDVMCAKTVRDVEIRYRFLLERYQRVVSEVPDKDLARFLGITPQGLSRFLRKKSGNLT